MSPDTSGSGPVAPSPSSVALAEGFAVTSTGMTRLLDVLATGVACGLLLAVALDAAVPGRPVLALVFFVTVPGWAALRLAGARPSSLMAFCAVALSVSLTMVLGEVARNAAPLGMEHGDDRARRRHAP